jgi:hypothetical protein
MSNSRFVVFNLPVCHKFGIFDGMFDAAKDVFFSFQEIHVSVSLTCLLARQNDQTLNLPQVGVHGLRPVGLPQAVWRLAMRSSSTSKISDMAGQSHDAQTLDQ